ncbi:hypothetical protein BZG36_00175 [Bifiguratus adelaidae]|uniref:Glutathione S-transferase n=1 Tax=Bifiguratus adelaidae TaxID=1938954 RepID=A0A261Y8X6_9FUNG|nr:hypothetical protein BZG36_00175 [Bifiguratus adelaidae]
MSTPSITLYTAGTPNGFKASITLEELGIPYKTHKIDFSTNEQKEEWYLKINPNGRIPAIVDHSQNDFAVFESGAIMLYLCDLYDPKGTLVPKDPIQRSNVVQWLMFQMGGIGPMQGQANHFYRAAPEKIEYAQKRYRDETVRLYGVLERGLSVGGKKEYLANNTFSVADIANWSWVAVAGFIDLDLNEWPHVKEWFLRVAARPGVQKGYAVPDESRATMIEDVVKKLS